MDRYQIWSADLGLVIGTSNNLEDAQTQGPVFDTQLGAWFPESRRKTHNGGAIHWK